MTSTVAETKMLFYMAAIISSLSKADTRRKNSLVSLHFTMAFAVCYIKKELFEGLA